MIAPETGIQLTLTGSSFLVVEVGDSLSDEFAARQNGIPSVNTIVADSAGYLSPIRMSKRFA